MARLRVDVVGGAGDEGVAFRGYLHSSDGEFQWPLGTHVRYSRNEETHFLAEDFAEWELAAGTYCLRVERGTEFVPFLDEVRVGDGETIVRRVKVERWVDMAGMGWYSGDLHVHRAPEDLRLAVLAESVNVGTNITMHNSHIVDVESDSARVELGESCVVSTMDAEIERLRDGPGAIVLLGLHRRIDAGVIETLYPTDAHFAGLAKRQGGHVDAEKPLWKGTPVNAALGIVDSMGVVPNHFHRNKVWRETATFGALEQDVEFSGDEGFAHWILSLYYRYLNCGLRVPASGGSATGIMPSPLGYCRTYVLLERAFDYDDWFTALRNGKSFATNGPMLFLKVDGAEPGALLRFALEDAVTLDVEAVAQSGSALDYVELVQDGVVIGRVEASLDVRQLEARLAVEFRRSGWIAARCFERVDGNVRYAQTSPVYVFMGTDQIASRTDAAYFLDVVDRQIEQAAGAGAFETADQAEEVLGVLEAARSFYEQVIRLAEERLDSSS